MNKLMMVLLLLGCSSSFASEIHNMGSHLTAKTQQGFSADKMFNENRHLSHKTIHLSETGREELLALFLLSKRPITTE